MLVHFMIGHVLSCPLRNTMTDCLFSEIWEPKPAAIFELSIGCFYYTCNTCQLFNSLYHTVYIQIDGYGEMELF